MKAMVLYKVGIYICGVDDDFSHLAYRLEDLAEYGSVSSIEEGAGPKCQIQ